MLPPDNFQETPAAGRRAAHLADQYRRLSAVGRVGPRFRLDQPCRSRRPHRRDDVDHRAHGAVTAAISTTGTTRSTLQPLYPLYVSSVDSGNLAGHLVARRRRLRRNGPRRRPFICRAISTGMLDTVVILEESLDELPDDRRQLRPLRQRLRDRIDGMRRAVDTIKRSRKWPRSARSTSPSSPARSASSPPPSIPRRVRSSSEILADWAAKLEDTCEAHVHDAHSDDRAAVAALRKRLEQLRDRARKYRLRDELLVPAARGPQAAVDRLPRRRAPARRKLLRPACFGSAADQPVRHRQGRHPDRTLVQAWPSDRRDRLPRRADVVVGLDVRISDAAAGDEGAAGRHPQPDQSTWSSSGRSSMPARSRSRGASRKPPTTPATAR